MYRDCCRTTQEKPYMRHKMNTSVTNIGFCPYEDVLGVAHAKGYASLLIPGKQDLDTWGPIQILISNSALVVVLARYIVLLVNSVWHVTCLPITWHEKLIICWHRCSLLVMRIINLTHQLFRFIDINLWMGFFSSEVFSVWDTGIRNTY